jgi:hypothetical protein
MVIDEDCAPPGSIQTTESPPPQASMPNGALMLSLGALLSHCSYILRMPCETIDGSANSIIVKVATIDDLDDLTKIAQAGFPDDPEFDYRFPRRRKYPEDNWLWTRKEYEGYLNQPDKYAVLLATLPANESGEQNGDHQQGPDLNRSQPISVALAVWDTAVTIDSQVGGLLSLHAS